MMISKYFDTLFIATKTTHQKIYSVFFFLLPPKINHPTPTNLAHTSLFFTLFMG